MSDKKSHHHSNRTQQHAAKEQYKKLYVQHIREICKASGTEEAFDLIPADGLHLLYLIHGLPLQILPAPGHMIPESELHEARFILNSMLPLQTYTPVPDGNAIPLQLFFSAGFSFFYYLSQEKLDASPITARLRRLMQAQIGFHGGYEQAHQTLNNVLLVVLTHLTNLQTSLYSVTYRTKPRPKLTPGIAQFLELKKETPPQKHVVLDGKPRPVIRLGFGGCNKGVTYVSVRPKQLGWPDTGTEPALDVYFQSHVLTRLHERLDCINENIYQYGLFSAMHNFHACRDDTGRLLVEYRLLKMKVGYLVVEPHGTMLIIRTFLFLTNSSTPEGKKLRSLYGLQRRDTDYLAIDKLSAFMSEDLYQTKELHPILQVIGCENLSQMFASMKNILTKTETQHTGTLLAQYLGLMPDNNILSSVPKCMPMDDESMQTPDTIQQQELVEEPVMEQ